MAPLQKAGIVALVKKRTADMTLAIGDGKFHTVILLDQYLMCPKNWKYVLTSSLIFISS